MSLFSPEFSPKHYLTTVSKKETCKNHRKCRGLKLKNRGSKFDRLEKSGI